MRSASGATAPAIASVIAAAVEPEDRQHHDGEHDAAADHPQAGVDGAGHRGRPPERAGPRSPGGSASPRSRGPTSGSRCPARQARPQSAPIASGPPRGSLGAARPTAAGQDQGGRSPEQDVHHEASMSRGCSTSSHLFAARRHLISVHGNLRCIIGRPGEWGPRAARCSKSPGYGNPSPHDRVRRMCRFPLLRAKHKAAMQGAIPRDARRMGRDPPSRAL